jgi:hypothetical protein
VEEGFKYWCLLAVMAATPSVCLMIISTFPKKYEAFWKQNASMCVYTLILIELVAFILIPSP